MPVTPPDTDELLLAMREDAYDDDEAEEFAERSLQQAADLWYMATGMTEDPTDETHLRILQYALLEMGMAFFIQSEDRGAMYSPFSSERIGSYSYSKATQAVMAAEATGIPYFDIAVAFFGSLAEDGSNANFPYKTENVFPQPFESFETRVEDDNLILHDPSVVEDRIFGG